MPGPALVNETAPVLLLAMTEFTVRTAPGSLLVKYNWPAVLAAPPAVNVPPPAAVPIVSDPSPAGRRTPPAVPRQSVSDARAIVVGLVWFCRIVFTVVLVAPSVILPLAPPVRRMLAVPLLAITPPNGTLV